MGTSRSLKRSLFKTLTRPSRRTSKSNSLQRLKVALDSFLEDGSSASRHSPTDSRFHLARKDNRGLLESPIVLIRRRVRNKESTENNSASNHVSEPNVEPHAKSCHAPDSGIATSPEFHHFTEERHMKSPSPAKPVEHRIVAAPIAAPQSTFLGASSFFGIDFVTPTSVSKHFASGLPLRQLEHSSEDNALVYEIVCPEKHITRRFYVALAAQAAKAIAEMPLLRPIEWRGQQDLLNIRTVNKGSPSNAAVIYTRGSESSTPCSRCQRGLGPFVRCITAQGPRGEVVGFGACSSCIWSAQPHLCTLRDDREYLASKNETHRARSLSLKKAPKPTRVPSKSSTRSFPTLKAFMKEIAPYQDDPKVIRAARDAVRGALTTLNKCLATLEAASRKDLAEDELSSDGWNEFR